MIQRNIRENEQMSCIFQVLVHVSAHVLTQVTRAYTPFLQPRATADTRKLGHRACERHQPHTEHRHSSSQLRADQRRYLRQCTAEVSHREHRHNIEAQSTSAQISVRRGGGMCRVGYLAPSGVVSTLSPFALQFTSRGEGLHIFHHLRFAV